MPRRGKKKTGGRPPIIADDTRRQQILDNLAAAVPLSHAAALSGISYYTLALWIRTGKEALDRRAAGEPALDNDDLYIKFLHDAEIARAKSVALSITHVQKAAKGGYVKSERRYVDEEGRTVTERTYADVDWKAAAWLLERIDRSAFGKATYVTLDAVHEQFGLAAPEDTGQREQVGGRGGDEIVETLSLRLIETRRRVEADEDEGDDVVDAEIDEGDE